MLSAAAAILLWKTIFDGLLKIMSDIPLTTRREISWCCVDVMRECLELCHRHSHRHKPYHLTTAGPPASFHPGKHFYLINNLIYSYKAMVYKKSVSIPDRSLPRCFMTGFLVFFWPWSCSDDTLSAKLRLYPL